MRLGRKYHLVRLFDWQIPLLRIYESAYSWTLLAAVSLKRSKKISNKLSEQSQSKSVIV